MFRFFSDEILRQKERWILWIPVLFGMGIGGYFSLKTEPSLIIGPAVSVLLLMALVPFYRNRAFVIIWLGFFAVSAGFTAAQVRAFVVAAPALEKKTYAITLRGTIADIDVLPKSYRVTLEHFDVVDGFFKQANKPERVRVRLKPNDKAQPVVGDLVEVKAVLFPIASPVLPGAYDFQRASFFKRLGATGYALSDVQVINARHAEGFFEGLRNVIRQRVRSATSDRNMAGLSLAFLIGDSSAISERDWDTARQSGIAHLIAISGSHFVLLTGMVFFMVRAMLAAIPGCALHWPIKKISAGVAALIALFYMMLIGAPVPAQRAAIMSTVIMLAIIFDRDPLSLRLVAFAAMVVLFFEPESLVGASFQLSFAAVIGLIAFFEANKSWWRELYRNPGMFLRLGLFIFTCLLTTIVAMVATAPFALYHFLHMPVLASLISNAVAVPLSSFVTIPFGFFTCLLIPFHLEAWPLFLMQKSLSWIMFLAAYVVKEAPATLDVAQWPVLFFVPLALGWIWVCLWQGRIRWLGLVPAVLITALIIFQPQPDVLLSGEMDRQMAARGEDGILWISSKRKGEFVREAWIERAAYGPERVDYWPESGVAAGGLLTCDVGRCVYQRHGYNVIFIKAMSLSPDFCRSLDKKSILVLMSDARPRDCSTSAMIIDRWDIYERGAHAIYLAENASPIVKTVAGNRGVRSWSQQRSNVRQRND